MNIRLDVGVALVLLFGATVAKAGHVDLPYRNTVAAQSKVNGLAGKSIQPMQRVAGPGREAVMTQLLSLLAPSKTNDNAVSSPVMKYDSDYVMATGAGWFVQVRGEGEWIRYLNHGYLTSPSNVLTPLEAKAATNVVESLAREVLNNELAPFVSLGAGEQLQAWTASYLASVSTDATGVVNRSIAASRMIFIRVINGVPVLGPGSKVSVTLANDGTLVGFDVDWPELRPVGNVSATVDITTIRARADQIMGIAPGAKRRPVENLLECGLYDPGVDGAAVDAHVSPACVMIVDPDPAASGFLTKFVVPIGTN